MVLRFMVKNNDYFNTNKIDSHNALFNFVVTNRNSGKTWALKLKAIGSFIKKGYVTIWLRRFTSDIKNRYLEHFYTNKMISINKKVDFAKLTRKGQVFYYNKKPFLYVVSLSSQQKLKGFDIPNVKYIVYDEFTTTQQKYNHYRGNEAIDFLDLYMTFKRNNNVKCYFLGNKETFTNPYYTFFNIKPPPIHFEGIKKYKQNSILIYQDNKLLTQNIDNLSNALLDTPYYKYLFDGDMKTQQLVNFSKLPSGAILYLQFYYANNVYQIKVSNNNYYVVKALDKNNIIFTFNNAKLQSHKNLQYYILTIKDKSLLLSLEYAIKQMRVFAIDYETLEALNYFINKLNFIS